MKSYRGEAAQVSKTDPEPARPRRFSRLSDHTTYMQTSTVMKLLCVYMCASSYIDLLHSALPLGPHASPNQPIRGKSLQGFL